MNRRRIINGLKIAGVVCLLVVVAVLTLIAGVDAYHAARFRECTTDIAGAQQAGMTSAAAGDRWEQPAPETFSPKEVRELRQTARNWNQKVGTIAAKGRRYPKTQLYYVGDMVYFVFFGKDDRIADFECVEN